MRVRKVRLKKKLSRIHQKLSSLKNRTKFNSVRLHAKLNDSEPKKFNLRRRKRVRRILLFATLAVAVGSIWYYQTPIRTCLLKLAVKLNKESSPDLNTDSTINTNKRSRYSKFLLIALIFVASCLISDKSEIDISDKSNIEIKSPIQRDPDWPEKHPFILIIVILEMAGLGALLGFVQDTFPALR